MGIDAYRDALAGFLAADGAAMMPAVSDDAERPAAMAGHEPWDYYGAKRSTSPHWVNEVTVHSLYELMTLDVVWAADLLERTPLRSCTARPTRTAARPQRAVRRGGDARGAPGLTGAPLAERGTAPSSTCGEMRSIHLR